MRDFCGQKDTGFSLLDFVRAARAVPALAKEELDQIFRLLDENADGALSYDEMHKMLVSVSQCSLDHQDRNKNSYR